MTSEVNIWTDRTAAATLRSLAGGNETVPTVVVGGTAFVNPSAAEVLAATRAAGVPAPEPPVKAARRSLGFGLAGAVGVLRRRVGRARAR